MMSNPLHQFHSGFPGLHGTGYQGGRQNSPQQYTPGTALDPLAEGPRFALQSFNRPAWGGNNFQPLNRSPSHLRIHPPSIQTHGLPRTVPRDSAGDNRGGIRKGSAVIRRRISRAW